MRSGSPAGSGGPGFGLLFVGLGIAVGLWGLFVLPWAEGEGGMLLDIRDALAVTGEASNVPEMGRDYVGWVAFATFLVAAALGVAGTVGRDSDTKWLTQTLAVGAALAGCAIHYAGVDQLFYFSGAPAAGTVAMYPAYVLLLIGGFLGPRRPPPEPVPSWLTEPTNWEPPSPPGSTNWEPPSPPGSTNWEPPFPPGSTNWEPPPPPPPPSSPPPPPWGPTR